MKPTVFIGASSESQGVADAINLLLEHDAYSTVWTEHPFPILDSTLSGLVQALDKYIFSVFVFSADDLTWMRAKERKVVRDNVLFELGLFLGRRGPRNCFAVAPRKVKPDFPSDLFGATLLWYDDERAKTEPTPALKPAVTMIKDALNERARELRIRPGVYAHNVPLEIHTGWETYDDRAEGQMSAEAGEYVSFKGPFEHGWRYPAAADYLSGSPKFFAFRVRSDGNFVIYARVEAGDRQLFLKIDQADRSWGRTKAEDEFKIPMPAIIGLGWQVFILDLAPVERDIAMTLKAIRGLRVRGTWTCRMFGASNLQMISTQTFVGMPSTSLEQNESPVRKSRRRFQNQHKSSSNVRGRIESSSSSTMACVFMCRSERLAVSGQPRRFLLSVLVFLGFSLLARTRCRG